jgi:hypothetical protein
VTIALLYVIGIPIGWAAGMALADLLWRITH